MKRLFFLCACLLFPGTVCAAPDASSAPAGYPPALPSSPSVPSTPSAPMPLPDYLGQDTVPLSASEKKALRLSSAWSGRGPAPVLTFAGKLIYVHGACLPTILAAPMQVCDVELQPGERVHEIVVGDTARWMVETGATGSGSQETVHLFIKPVDAGLETSAVVTTDRRVYHLRLVSQRKGHTPYVGFTYSDQLKVELAEKRAVEERASQWNSSDISIDGQAVDLSQLNFNYTVSGKASWKPLRVYDDGKQMCIRLPESIPEMPVLLVRKGDQNIIVNYRVKDASAMVVDGLFDKISLILGVGKEQEEILIERVKR